MNGLTFPRSRSLYTVLVVSGCRITLLSFFIFVLIPCFSNAQQRLDYQSTVESLKKVKSEKIGENTANTLSLAVNGVVGNNYAAGALKDVLFHNPYLSKRKVERISSVSDQTEGQILQIWHKTKVRIPHNLSDRSARAFLSGDGKHLKAKIERMYGSVRSEYFSALEAYEPIKAARIINTIVDPSVFDKKRREGGGRLDLSNTSWGSSVLIDAYYFASLAELARNSTVAKLLINDRKIVVLQQIDFSFPFSDLNDVTLRLEPVSWSYSDIPALVGLLNNPYWSGLARAQLEKFNEQIKNALNTIPTQK